MRVMDTPVLHQLETCRRVLMNCVFSHRLFSTAPTTDCAILVIPLMPTVCFCAPPCSPGAGRTGQEAPWVCTTWVGTRDEAQCGAWVW